MEKEYNKQIPDYVWDEWEKTRKEILYYLHKYKIDIPIVCSQELLPKGKIK